MTPAARRAVVQGLAITAGLGAAYWLVLGILPHLVFTLLGIN